MEWLREIRRKQFAACGQDVHKLFEMYRQRHREEMERRNARAMVLRDKEP